jgi:hypothetical protein
MTFAKGLLIVILLIIEPTVSLAVKGGVSGRLRDCSRPALSGPRIIMAEI